MKPMRAAASPGTSADRAPALIQARGLSKTYVTGSGEVTALKSLDFEIYDGEFVSVVGQSGCGKSTLLKVLAGLLPYTAGSVELNGKPLRGPTPQAAVVFQAPVLLPWRTVLDNVLLPIEFRKLPLASHRKSAADLLAMVGLSEFAPGPKLYSVSILSSPKLVCVASHFAPDRSRWRTSDRGAKSRSCSSPSSTSFVPRASPPR